MNRLYQKSKLWFALAWILVYVVGTGAADAVSKTVGLEKSITVLYLTALSVTAAVWICRNGLLRRFGICKGVLPPRKMLYYLPLAAMVSCNLWFGVQANYGLVETVLYIVSMLLVGFLEELIFRGFLFDAMRRDGLKSAVIVSSVTFGIGHIVNLFNGSGAELLPNLCQVCYAIAGGFLFVIIFHKTKSLLPCIVTHGLLNALSAFAVTQNAAQEILSAAALCAVQLLYALYLLKQKVPETNISS